jgi:hypothetical protein
VIGGTARTRVREALAAADSRVKALGDAYGRVSLVNEHEESREVSHAGT